MESKWGVQNAFLCGRDNETWDHMFFQCSITGYIWKLFCNELGIRYDEGDGLQTIVEGVIRLDYGFSLQFDIFGGKGI